jgi:hypothetical protein
VWRGIGCLLILIVPSISWILATATVRRAVADGWPLPYQLLGYPILPEVLWKVPGLVPLIPFVQRQQHLYLALVITLAYIIVAGGVMSFLYALLYRAFGPPRYGPVDLPPISIKVGRYKR